MRPVRFRLGLIVLLSAAAAATAADWPQWRGPQRDGLSQETGLLKTWPKEGPPLAWQVKGCGEGYGTVAVAGGHVYGTGSKGTDESVWAREEATGKEVWNTKFGSIGRQPAQGNGPRGTPTVDGGLVYALGASAELACFDAAKGQIKWHKNLARDFGGRMMSGWGWSESPLVDGDVVVCTPGADNAAMVALDKKTGAVKWKANVPGAEAAGHGSIVIAEVGGIKQYINWAKSFLFAVNAKDGKFLWKYEKGANRTANIPTPVVKGDLVFCSNAYKTGSALLKLIPDGKGGIKAEEQYFLDARTFANHHGGVVLVGDYLYGGHDQNKGIPVCLELATGKIAWRRDRAPGEKSAAVVYADGNLVFRYEGGQVVLIEATPTEFREKGKFNPVYDSGRPEWPHPVIANGKLYLRDQDVLMCYDVRDKSTAAK